MRHADWGRAISLRQLKPGQIALAFDCDGMPGRLVLSLVTEATQFGIEKGSTMLLCEAGSGDSKYFSFFTGDQVVGASGWLLPDNWRVVPSTAQIDSERIDLHRTRTCRLFLDEAGEMHLAGIHSRESLRHFASWANISRATTFVEIDSHRSQWLNFPVWSIEIGSAERPTKVWSSSH